MNAESRASNRAEIVDEVSKWTVGLGIVGVALFPLALPIVILTVVALLPLLVPLLAVALVAGAFAVPVLLIRKVRATVSGIGPRRRKRAASASSRPVTGH